MSRSPRCLALGVAAGLVAFLAFVVQPEHSNAQSLPIPTTIDAFHQPGTQPETLSFPVIASGACTNCHAGFDPVTAPWDHWTTSIMSQASRDPLFHACLAIAEQDAAFSGDLCLRCHTPSAWLEGRSDPTDGSAVSGLNDHDGVTCHLCHRMVDPIYEPGNPAEDVAILAALPAIPTDAHTGQYVIDPEDRRRGPFDLISMPFHEWRISPYHREAKLCGTCHDVSNPVYERVGDNYAPTALDAEHPDHDKYNEFPIERTYSEWTASAFAAGPIDMGGRFGGNHPLVSTCQDCHMPKTEGYACSFYTNYRTDLPIHDFNGSHTWVLDAILNLDVTLSLYDSPSYMPPWLVVEAQDRNVSMLERASDLELEQIGSDLNVRVVNQTGHKFPSGYPEGRRVWINVQFKDAAGFVLLEHGHYDWDTADLTTDTKVYETQLGLDATMAAVTGLPEGHSFHFALNNKIYKDNRIPPRGFDNAGFAAVQAAPVDYSYADGQYWDDTLYSIPAGAVSAIVRVYYQTSSKEYIEFLRDENVTNDAGEVLYQQWAMLGKSEPVLIDEAELMFADQPFIRGDCNTDGLGDLSDPIFLLEYLLLGGAPSNCPSSCDFNDDGGLDLSDAIFGLGILFQGFVTYAPFPDCGTDPTVDMLTCPLFSGCP